jgi:hypothetical protein
MAEPKVLDDKTVEILPYGVRKPNCDCNSYKHSSKRASSLSRKLPTINYLCRMPSGHGFSGLLVVLTFITNALPTFKLRQSRMPILSLNTLTW